MTYTCPICGYPGLNEPPRFPGGGATYTSCLSCGFEFGYHDEARNWTYREWREQWVTNGMPWQGLEIRPPDGWDPRKQLEELLAHGDTSEDDVYRGD